MQNNWTQFLNFLSFLSDNFPSYCSNKCDKEREGPLKRNPQYQMQTVTNQSTGFHTDAETTLLYVMVKAGS